MNWYYTENGQQAGPVDDAQLDELIRSGKVQPDTLLWREGMPAWVPCREVKGGAKPASPAIPVAGAPAQVVCAECGKTFPIDETIPHGNARVCAACKPVFLQKLAEGAALNTGQLNYAGFGIRFGAKFIDGLILGVPFMIVYVYELVSMNRGAAPPQLGIVPALTNFGFLFVQLAYQVFFLGKFGATPGKMACKLKVVRSDGSPIGYGRAAGRFFAELLSGLICYIGYIMVAFDKPQRRALHDHICNTRVVYK